MTSLLLRQQHHSQARSCTSWEQDQRIMRNDEIESMGMVDLNRVNLPDSVEWMGIVMINL
jgi:hypothetical protein